MAGFDKAALETSNSCAIENISNQEEIFNNFRSANRYANAKNYY